MLSGVRAMIVKDGDYRQKQSGIMPLGEEKIFSFLGVISWTKSDGMRTIVEEYLILFVRRERMDMLFAI